MKIVKGNKPGYESPQVQIELLVDDVLLNSPAVDNDFVGDAEDWD